MKPPILESQVLKTVQPNVCFKIFTQAYQEQVFFSRINGFEGRILQPEEATCCKSIISSATENSLNILSLSTSFPEVQNFLDFNLEPILFKTFSDSI